MCDSAHFPLPRFNRQTVAFIVYAGLAQNLAIKIYSQWPAPEWRQDTTFHLDSNSARMFRLNILKMIFI